MTAQAACAIIRGMKGTIDMSATCNTKLTIKKSNSLSENGGFVLYGRTEGIERMFRGRPTNWLEKWFATIDKAEKYAIKIGYEFEVST